MKHPIKRLRIHRVFQPVIIFIMIEVEICNLLGMSNVSLKLYFTPKVTVTSQEGSNVCTGNVAIHPYSQPHTQSNFHHFFDFTDVGGGHNRPFFDFLPGQVVFGHFLGADSENHTHFGWKSIFSLLPLCTKLARMPSKKAISVWSLCPLFFDYFWVIYEFLWSKGLQIGH